MDTSDLPLEVVEMLASQEMRTHHSRWHYVRNRWHMMEEPEKEMYRAMDYEPPRLDPVFRPTDLIPAPSRDAGAGLDFLFMHRRMIQRLNEVLAGVNDPNYPKVEGWKTIPWDHNDPDWPMPPAFAPYVQSAKSIETTTFFKLEAEEKFEKGDWYLGRDLDEIGAEIERGIHSWMHMHWSDRPWFQSLPGQNRADVRNDYLGSTYSSHVNKVFWKLHGWIDDRISKWETVNNSQANFSNSWEGPMHFHDHHPVSVMAEMGGNKAFNVPVSVIPLTRKEEKFSREAFLFW